MRLTFKDLTEEDMLSAKLHGVSKKVLSSRLYNRWDKHKAITHPVKKHSKRDDIENDLFSVYVGDELKIIGTADECAEKMGWKRGGITTRFYTAPSIYARQSAKENGVLVERLVDDDDED